MRVARTYRLDPGLILRVEERADELGQSLTVFVTRALEKALGDGAVASASSRPSDWDGMDEALSKPPKAFANPKALASGVVSTLAGAPIAHHPKCACGVCKPPKS